MASQETWRKAQFAAALKLAGMTFSQWATKNQITRQHLYYVLNGERNSPALVEKVDEFIRKQLMRAA